MLPALYSLNPSCFNKEYLSIMVHWEIFLSKIQLLAQFENAA